MIWGMPECQYFALNFAVATLPVDQEHAKISERLEPRKLNAFSAKV
jgi:hypothetical protein